MRDRSLIDDLRVKKKIIVEEGEREGSMEREG